MNWWHPRRPPRRMGSAHSGRSKYPPGRNGPRARRSAPPTIDRPRKNATIRPDGRQSLPRSSASAAGGDWRALPRRKRKRIAGQMFEAVAMRQRRHIVEERAHPQTVAAHPAQGQIDGAAGGMGCRGLGIVAGRGPIALDFGQQSLAFQPGCRDAAIPQASRYRGNRPAPRAAARHRTDKAQAPLAPPAGSPARSLSATLWRNNSRSVAPAILRQ